MPIVRPADSFFEAVVVTGAAEADLAKLAEPAAVVALLQARHCGDAAACAAVRGMVTDATRTALEIATTERWILPGREQVGPAAPSLSPPQLDQLYRAQHVIVVRIREPRAPGVADAGAARDHLAMRAGLAVTAALAEASNGFVYDEVRHHIVDAKGAVAMAITAPLGQSVFRPELITVEIAPDDDDTVRVLSRGLRRFGAPDLEFPNAPKARAAELSRVMNQLAARLAAGADTAPIALGPSDLGLPVGDAGAESVSFFFEPAPLDEGQPDNEILDVDTEDTLEADLARLFGGGSGLSVAELQSKVAVQLPPVLALYRKSPGGALLLRVELAVEGGTEAMWVEVATCDAAPVGKLPARCKGTLRNEPRGELMGADGKPLHSGSAISVRVSDVSGYIFRGLDGGAEELQ